MERLSFVGEYFVSGRSNYTLMERWKRSTDGSKLTIRRTIVRNSGETEPTLVYENPLAVAKVQPAPQAIFGLAKKVHLASTSAFAQTGALEEIR